jgi:hypothetical protein
MYYSYWVYIEVFRHQTQHSMTYSYWIDWAKLTFDWTEICYLSKSPSNVLDQLQLVLLGGNTGPRRDSTLQVMNRPTKIPNTILTITCHLISLKDESLLTWTCVASLGVGTFLCTPVVSCIDTFVFVWNKRWTYQPWPPFIVRCVNSNCALNISWILTMEGNSEDKDSSMYDVTPRDGAECRSLVHF